MKATTKIHSLLAASLLAFAPVARAQLVTASTIDFANLGTINFNPNGSMGQTFTDILAINSLTFTFLSYNTTSAIGGSLTATFGEWNTATSSFVGGTTVALGNIAVAAPNTWGSSIISGSMVANFSATLDLSFTQYGTNMDPNSTYAILLTNNSASTTSFGLALAPNVFSPNGLANPDGIGDGAATTPFNTFDWGFSSLIYVPDGNVVPVPESSTIAAIVGIILVAGLASFRIVQRRKQALAAAVVG